MPILKPVEYQISALNDLIRLNKDRVSAYKMAIKGIDDEEPLWLFYDLINQSEQHISELKSYIKVLGGNLYDGTTLSGKFYHAWMDLRSTFTPTDKQVILYNCEYSEDVVKSTYKKALQDKELVYSDKQVVTLLINQYKNLKTAYRKIKTLRASVIDA